MTSRAKAVLAPVREWLVLEKAESTARAYTPAQQARVAAHTRAAESRIRAARSLSEPLSASVLLRSAIHQLVYARSVAAHTTPEERGRGATPDHTDGLPELVGLLGALPLSDAPRDVELALAALTSPDSLYLDQLPVEALEATRGALERVARHLRAQIEPRTRVNVRATRWGRWASMAVVLAYVAFRALCAVFLPTNVALHKPVHPSSYKHNPPDGHELVDGQPISSFGIHTNTEDSPRVVIDPLRPYTITTIRVYNRGDGGSTTASPSSSSSRATANTTNPSGAATCISARTRRGSSTRTRAAGDMSGCGSIVAAISR